MCDLVELWTLSWRNFRVIHDLFFFSKYFKNIHDLDIFDYIYVSFRSCIKSLRNIDFEHLMSLLVAQKLLRIHFY